jgi:hypothetical protein
MKKSVLTIIAILFTVSLSAQSVNKNHSFGFGVQFSSFPLTHAIPEVMNYQVEVSTLQMLLQLAYRENMNMLSIERFLFPLNRVIFTRDYLTKNI